MENTFISLRTLGLPSLVILTPVWRANFVHKQVADLFSLNGGWNSEVVKNVFVPRD